MKRLGWKRQFNMFLSERFNNTEINVLVDIHVMMIVC